LARMRSQLDAQRQTLEERERDKRAAGQFSRAVPKLSHTMADFMDVERSNRKREELFHEAFKESYNFEKKEVLLKGFKFAVAGPVLRPAAESPFLPNLLLTSLASGEDRPTVKLLERVMQKRVSLVTFVYNQFGVPHVNSFLEPFRAAFPSLASPSSPTPTPSTAAPSLQVIQCNIEENWAKSMIFKWLLRWLRWKIPRAEHDNYLLGYENIKDARRRAGMSNATLGWVNLVDGRGRVRWQAHGDATPEEIDALITVTKELLN
ncbi:hypothetical protein CXG81DRAFT_2878, partial [Caulochytrium protostelioides]